MRAAVTDIGTNSSHLLIAECHEGGYQVLQALKIRTKLGECLDTAGYLNAEGEDRLAGALTQFRELARAAGVPEIKVYATSALREAPNGQEVAGRMLERTGVYPVIISGVREGELTYLGVTRSVRLGPDNVLLDLGGGSLELVRGDAKSPKEVLSLPLGSIRMTQQFVPDGEGKASQLKALRKSVRASLEPMAYQFKSAASTQFVLSSGTAEAAAQAMSAGRGESEGSVNGLQFTLTEIGDLLDKILDSKPKQRAKIPGLKNRLNNIVAGITVLYTVLEQLEASQFTLSEGALREGMLVEQLQRLESLTSV